MATYTKEISRSVSVSEDDERLTVTIVQRESEGSDIVVLDEDAALGVYLFLHRKFGGQ